jgi:hypothetical protein
LQSLATVPEGEELRDSHNWFGFKIASVLVGLIICIAGIKEGTHFMRGLVRGGEARYDTASLGLSPKVQTKANNLITGIVNSDLDVEGEAAAYSLMRKAQIPKELSFLAGVYDPLLPSDRAFLWHIPRCASNTVKSIAGQCFGLLLATESGGSATSDKLSIIADLEGGHYVNVDTSTPTGIEHAKNLNVANLPGLNLVASSYFYDAAEKLFSEQHRGRCIAMMRHPVDRAVSLYAFLANDPKNTVVLPGMSLEDYVNSDRVERNWMTRFLSNAKEDELTAEHLAIAKKVLETKCLVGLLKFKGESLSRIETYFGWTIDGEKASDCHMKLLDWNWPNKNKHNSVKEGSETWRKLETVNNLDMQLYKYAEKIYKLQGEAIFRSSGR